MTGVPFRARVTDAGVPVLTFVGCEAEQLFGQALDPAAPDWGLSERLHPEDRDTFWRAVVEAVALRAAFRHEARFITPDGALKWIQCVAAPAPQADGVAYDGFLLDVSEARLVEAEVHRLSAVVEQMGDALLVTDRHGVIQYVNRAFEEHLGYTKEEIIGKKPNVLKSGYHDSAFFTNLWTTVLSGQVFRAEMINRHKDGRLVYEEKTISPLRDEAGRIVLLISTARDITARREAEMEVRRGAERLRALNEELERRVADRTDALARANEALGRLATEDPLTGLANRRRFDETLAVEIRRAVRREEPLSLLVCDVDFFKSYNDHYGHPAGDRCLVQVAETIRDTFRRVEDLAARNGGDEFAVILPGVSGDGARVLAEWLQTRLAYLAIPHEHSSVSRSVTLSIGIVSGAVRSGRDPAWFVQQADRALYRSKDAGKSTVTVIEPDSEAP
jgi:diguanylate cyclase (GGDEF)-like protein/PAS domain S-box-containing protein